MNILHLLDMHFGRNYECYRIKDEFDNKDQILNDLIDCVKDSDVWIVNIFSDNFLRLFFLYSTGGKYPSEEWSW